MSHSSFSPIMLIAIVCSAGLAIGDEPTADTTDSKGMMLFDTQIKPVLVKHCYECHSDNGEDIGAGLELDSPTGMMRGGDSGPVIVPHEPAKSLLIQMLRHDDDVSPMPPEDKLSEESIAAFVEWIRLGAPDSRKDTGRTTKDDRLEAGQRHWSFQPLRRVDPPTVQQADWPRGAIDRFILARMEAEDLKPVADANRRTLVRRVYFDLVGLPPSPREVEQFVADQSPEAISNLIDHLLDSPRFGERWGRHWLDVVRYAESSGMEFNFTYPHAWPYRDYVIDALNQDKPYDVFLREQIAGDLMSRDESESAATLEARLIAPSMLAFGPKRHNSSGTEFQMDVVDDQINTLFRATQAMTVACARCHDHKFDPIPTKDYYALAGIFLSTQPLYGTIKQKYSNNPTDLLPIGPNAAAMHAAAEEHDEKTQEAEKELAAKREKLKQAAAVEKLATAKKAEAEKLVQSQSATLEAGVTPEATAALDEAEEALTTVSQQATTLKDEVASLETAVADLQKSAPPRPAYAMSARDRAKTADTKVAIRGDYRERGEVVPRGFLSAVSMVDPPTIDAQHSGRLELAQWITRPDNPLTARVMVNRIWHHLFGRGLVETVDNFGVIGKPASHPELLDTLALQFIRDGWSVKKMIRTIMLSRAYQLSSARDAEHMQIDPDNRLFWRATPRRLEAEAIRDAILTVSGQLDLERPAGSTVTPLGDQLVRGISTEEIQPPSNHRSVFLPVVRDYVPELFDLFDFPSPSLVSGNRSVTNVPAQALYLRNSTFVAEQAQHAARRLLASADATNDEQRADLATRWAMGRGTSDSECAAALQLVRQIQRTETAGDGKEVDAWAAWFHTLFTAAEFRYLVDCS